MTSQDIRTITRVLIIDDEEAMRDVTRRSLEERGFVCEVAQDGFAAENALRRSRFEVVLTDLRMPRKNGHQFIVDLIQSRQRPTIVVLTGVCEPKIVYDLLMRGVSDVILKPCNYDLLAAKLKAFVERCRSHEAVRESV